MRGETASPSLSDSSFAIRSSPHVGLARAIATISCWRFLGIRGRPRGRDVQRQKSRQPARCQRINVSGCTTVSTAFQSMTRARSTNATRVAGSARRGFA